jgi:hypothetical protein
MKIQIFKDLEMNQLGIEQPVKISLEPRKPKKYFSCENTMKAGTIWNENTRNEERGTRREMTNGC